MGRVYVQLLYSSGFRKREGNKEMHGDAEVEVDVNSVSPQPHIAGLGVRSFTDMAIIN